MMRVLRGEHSILDRRAETVVTVASVAAVPAVPRGVLVGLALDFTPATLVEAVAAAVAGVPVPVK